jgi:hypothetical protein
LLDNGWVLLAVKPPARNEIYVFQPGQGFVQWQGTVHPLPQVQHSQEWYAGHHGHLSPAAVRGMAEVNHA